MAANRKKSIWLVFKGCPVAHTGKDSGQSKSQHQAEFNRGRLVAYRL
jgi:hypothetical protein